MDPMQNTTTYPELDGLKQEVLPPAGLLERAEASLFDRISQADGAEPWELYLKRTLISRSQHNSEAVTGRAEKKAFVVSLPLLFSSSSLFVAKSHIVQAAVGGRACFGGRLYRLELFRRTLFFTANRCRAFRTWRIAGRPTPCPRIRNRRNRPWPDAGTFRMNAAR